MNVLVVVYSLNLGGAERVTTNLVNYWADRGWHISVVTLASRDQDFYVLHPSVRRIALNLTDESRNNFSAIYNNIRRTIALRRVLRDIRPTVALGMMTNAGILLLLSTILMPKVATIALERSYPPRIHLGRIWGRLRRWTYPYANRVVMLTSEGIEWLNKEIPKARGMIIPNPVRYPLPRYEPIVSPDTVVGPKRSLLLAVGRLDQLKGFDLLVSAFANLAPTNSNWDLVVLGEGPLRQDLEMQVESLALTKRVFLPGRAGNVSDWYERADLYVMSSITEGFPNTLAEAMAHGCAVVSFDCDTGPRDLIRDGFDGMLVPPGDIAALERALWSLMNSYEMRVKLGSRAQEVRTRYSMQKILDMWDHLFEDARGKKGK